MDQHAPPFSEIPSHTQKGLTAIGIVLGILFVVSLGGNAYAFLQVQRLEGERVLAEQARIQAETDRDLALVRAADAEARLGGVAARATELATIGTYFKTKFEDLNKILLETDSNSVNFITWTQENASFKNAKEAKDQYAKWTSGQNETNSAYWALSKEVASYITTLETGSVPK